MRQYDHIYAAICIIIKLKVMFWKLYTRIYFNVGTFNLCVKLASLQSKDIFCDTNVIQNYMIMSIKIYVPLLNQ